MISVLVSMSIFFFNDTATTEIYTLSLHDALPISVAGRGAAVRRRPRRRGMSPAGAPRTSATRTVLLDNEAVQALLDPRHREDRKSTRLNSSHANISYAVFCLKKKKNTPYTLYLHI